MQTNFGGRFSRAARGGASVTLAGYFDLEGRGAETNASLRHAVGRAADADADAGRELRAPALARAPRGALVRGRRVAELLADAGGAADEAVTARARHAEPAGSLGDAARRAVRADDGARLAVHAVMREE